jgi:hypothetical protein
VQRQLAADIPKPSCLPGIFFTLGSLFVLFFVTGILAAAQTSPPWITRDQQEQIVRQLRTVLPPGWGITATSLNKTPDDWYTFDNRGFEVDGKNNEHVFHIWFLPKDWLGIRQIRATRLRLVYWEGVLIGRDFKAITNTDEIPVQEAIQQLDMSTPSLVNSGWYDAQALFGDRMNEIDSRAQSLVNHFCSDLPCKDEAAYSLIVLGVPARSVALDCAEHATAYAQGFCVSSLGYFGGQDSVQVLSRVISNPLTPPQVQKYAAMSLNSIADASSGPALLKALNLISWPEAAEQAVEALGRIRYEPAAPAILSRMQKEAPEARQQAYYARALAGLHYQSAVPAIEKLCKNPIVYGDWLLEEQQSQYLGWVPEIALMRLTAPWGSPSNGVRLLLLPSKGSSSDQNRVVAVIENVGDRDADILGPPGGDLIVDGIRYQHKGPVIMDGNITLRVDDVSAYAIDLTGLIRSGGTHHVEYQLGTAISNRLTLQVPTSFH